MPGFPRASSTQQWEILTVSDFGDYPKGRLQDYTPPQSPYNSAMPHTASEAYGSCRGRPVMSRFVPGLPANIQFLSHIVAMLYSCSDQEGMDGKTKSEESGGERRGNYPWWGFGIPLDHKVVQLVVTTTFGGSDMSRFVRTDHPQAGRVCATDPVWAGTSVDRGQEVQHEQMLKLLGTILPWSPFYVVARDVVGFGFCFSFS